MTDDASRGLLAALRASPDNPPLQDLVVDACLREGDCGSLEAAIALCGDPLLTTRPERLAQALRLFAAQGRDDLLARFAPEGSAEAAMLRARRLLADGDRSGAQQAYRDAVAMNPAIEDAALAAQLSGKVVSLADARGGRVPSIANDDTDGLDAARWLETPAVRMTFADVGGLDKVKKEIRRRIVTPFLKPSLFERFRRNSGGGILLYGPPGCGKTLLARATAGECGAKFYNVSITDVLDMYIGESERKLHGIFEQARRAAPSVIFFDEIEALGGKRQRAREATLAKLVSQFLTELDGFAQNNRNVLVLGATNVPWAIDPAFRRPGRFDRVLFVPPPDVDARRAILALQLEGRPLAEGSGLPEAVMTDIVRRTSGFSGADLRNLIDTAADEAIEASIGSAAEVGISAQHLRDALAQVRPTTLEWLTTARNHARYANEGGQYDEVLEFLRDQA